MPSEKLLEPRKFCTARRREAFHRRSNEAAIRRRWLTLFVAHCLSLALTVAVRRVLASVGAVWRVLRRERHRA
ncbi:MAG: hypothetical protein WCF10_01820, partial [Polyangiales bacterium]